MMQKIVAVLVTEAELIVAMTTADKMYVNQLLE